jgi:hypothetical protein
MLSRALEQVLDLTAHRRSFRNGWMPLPQEAHRLTLRLAGLKHGEDTAVGIFKPLRCRFCRWKRQQAYQVDFKPNEYAGFLFLSEPLYVCHRCLPRYQTDARVMRITRVLSESEVAT